MVGARSLTFLAALAVAGAGAQLDARQLWGLPQAQPRSSQSYSSAAYNEGYQRGVRTGQDDSRRGRPFSSVDQRDYRSADAGYRSQYGNRERYRDDFRLGYQAGYRDGYQQYGYDQRGTYGQRNGPPGPPPWSNGRARGRGRGGNSGYGPYGNNGNYGNYGNYGGYSQRYDLAVDNGYNDGYEQGLKDGRDRHANNPAGESWYRSGTRGYSGSYGSRDIYRNNYRQGFQQGYERGYQDGRLYR